MIVYVLNNLFSHALKLLHFRQFPNKYINRNNELGFSLHIQDV